MATGNQWICFQRYPQQLFTKLSICHHFEVSAAVIQSQFTGFKLLKMHRDEPRHKGDSSHEGNNIFMPIKGLLLVLGALAVFIRF